MKLYSLLLLLISITFVASFSKELEKEFKAYVKKFNKKYKNKFEENRAKKFFKKCLNEINETNKKNLGFTLAPSVFCDQDPKTFHKGESLSVPAPPLSLGRAVSFVDPSIYPPGPPSVDWTTSGCISRVKDESFYCGACYAFSAIAALEAHWCLKNNISVTMSEQMIIDCTNKYYGNKACEGGSQGASWTYIQNIADGIESDETYPYNEFNESIAKTFQPCKYNRSRSVATVIGYSRIRSNNPELIKNAIAAVGPVAASMNGAIPSFAYYDTGVYSDPACIPSMSHSVLIVGYGVDDSVDPPMPYWLCKNSWSSDWGGMQGYFKIQRGVNMCGIENQLVYPIVPDAASYKAKKRIG
ncbi:hypothetical protein PVAND_017242 [Polypedilum vanderplanki]|uniref:Uncharacterized protein n=1 Tax=Polypedilum vanderplanki TaxID=319348 RepID=A0A9J6BI18_POLVA|nr:hypothetical protein PVAND_017242 [Polypedilum vanderplanki]